MLHQLIDGQAMYEVGIYNKEVRALVKENQSHSYYDDYWADVQVRDIIAHDETEARELIEKRFPPEDGFVIEGVEESHF